MSGPRFATQEVGAAGTLGIVNGVRDVGADAAEGAAAPGFGVSATADANDYQKCEEGTGDETGKEASDDGVRREGVTV